MRILIIACLFLLSACAGTCPPCPAEKAYYPIGSSDYGILMWGTMDPGYFDDKDNWLTEEEYDDFMKEDEAEGKLEI